MLCSTALIISRSYQCLRSTPARSVLGRGKPDEGTHGGNQSCYIKRLKLILGISVDPFQHIIK